MLARLRFQEATKKIAKTTESHQPYVYQENCACKWLGSTILDPKNELS